MKTLIIALFTIISISSFAQDLTLFEYESPSNEAKLELKKNKRHFSLYAGTLDAQDPITKKSLKIPFDYYRTHNKKAPLVFVYPSLSKEIPIVENLIASKLARKGYNVIIARLVEDIADLERPLNKLDDFFIRSTVAFRMVLDKALLMPENDKNKVFALGVSLGGIRAALSLAVEPRLKASAIYVAGGDLPSILSQSKVGLIKDYRSHWMKKLNFHSVQEFENYVREYSKVEVLDYVSLRKTEEVMMVMGTRDEKVPYQNQRLLWEGFGRPQHLLVNKQHRIAGASFLVNFPKVLTFFEKF